MAEALRFCPYCGSRLLIEAQQFCATCGRPLTAAAGGPGAVAKAAVPPVRAGAPARVASDPNPVPTESTPRPPVPPTPQPTADVTPPVSTDRPAAAPAASPTVAEARAPGASAPGPGLQPPPAVGVATSVRPAHWALGASIALALGAVLPWLTSYFVSFSPLQLMGQSGYWLGVVLVAIASVGLAVAKVSAPVREASQVLWAWLWVTFGGAALLAVLYLVSLGSARSSGGLTGVVASSAGMGIGYLLFAGGAIAGLAVSVRAWRALGASPVVGGSLAVRGAMLPEYFADAPNLGPWVVVQTTRYSVAVGESATLRVENLWVEARSRSWLRSFPSRPEHVLLVDGLLELRDRGGSVTLRPSGGQDVALIRSLLIPTS